MRTARDQEPDDSDLFRQLQDSVQHIVSLNQQLADRAMKRGKSDLSQIQIEPRDPLDILLHELQAESERNKEDARLNANAIRALSTGLFTANSLLKRLMKKKNGNK